MVSKKVNETVTNYSFTVDYRLASIDNGAGTELGSYYYDPFGRRLWKDVGGKLTYFHYNDQGFI